MNHNSSCPYNRGHRSTHDPRVQLVASGPFLNLTGNSHRPCKWLGHTFPPALHYSYLHLSWTLHQWSSFGTKHMTEHSGSMRLSVPRHPCNSSHNQYRHSNTSRYQNALCCPLLSTNSRGCYSQWRCRGIPGCSNNMSKRSHPSNPYNHFYAQSSMQFCLWGHYISLRYLSC